MYNLIQKLFETFCQIISLGEGWKYYFGSFRFQNIFERMTSQPITNLKVEKFNTKIPNSDKPLISPNSITPESWEKRKYQETKETLDCKTNYPCQYPQKCMENSMQNLDTDVRV